MDFDLSFEHQTLRDSARRFVENELPRNKVLKWVADKEEPPRELFTKMAELGVYNFLMPPEYSGLDQTDPIGLVVFVQELARASSAICTIYGRSAVILGPTIAALGTKAQKDAIVPNIIEGKYVMALGLTEPNAGSDAASIKTKAVEQPDGSFLINGSKQYTTQIASADWLILIARSDPDKEKHKGLTAFLIENPGKHPNIEHHRLDTMGLSVAPTYTVSIKDLKVTPDQILGERGKGWQAVLRSLDMERLYHGAIGVGASQVIVDEVVDYLNQRIAFGRPLTRQQAIRHKLVDMQMSIDAAQLMTYRAAAKLAAGQECHREASMAKLSGAETYMRVANTGLQLMGGYGYCVESGMPMHFTDAKLFEIGGGAMEIQRNIIAKEMGL